MCHYLVSRSSLSEAFTSKLGKSGIFLFRAGKANKRAALVEKFSDSGKVQTAGSAGSLTTYSSYYVRMIRFGFQEFLFSVKASNFEPNKEYQSFNKNILI